MASSFPSLDFLGSSTNSDNSVTILCSSVNRTSNGFCRGNLSASIRPRSSELSHVNCVAIPSLLRTAGISREISMMFFADVISVPGGDFQQHLTQLLDQRLASPARVKMQVGSHI